MKPKGCFSPNIVTVTDGCYVVGGCQASSPFILKMLPDIAGLM